MATTPRTALNIIDGNLIPGGGLVSGDDVYNTKISRALQANTDAAAAALAAAKAAQAAIAGLPGPTGFGTNIQDVNNMDAPGSSGLAANDDHVHRGVHKLTETGDAYGDITLTGYIVSQIANQFTFDLSGGISTSYQEYADPTVNVPVVAAASLLTSNAHGVSFALPAASANSGRWCLIGTNFGSAVPVIAANGTDTIETNVGRGHVLYISNGVDTWRNMMSINSP